MSVKPTFSWPDRKLVTGTMATSASSVGTGVAAVDGTGVDEALVSVSDGEGETEAVDPEGADDELSAAARVGLGEGVEDAPGPPVSAFRPNRATTANVPPRIAGPRYRRFDVGARGGFGRR